MGVIDDFRAFISKGNVIDLAVGFIIGVAFAAVVTALVNDIIMPIISIPGSHDLSGYVYTIGGGTIMQGAFVTALINFVLIALVVFFVFVRPMARMKAREEAAKAVVPTTRECPMCLSNVPIKARRCMYCTADLPPA